MIYEKRQLVWTCVAAIALGTALHFFYEWLPCGITAVLSPVRESLWEHLKLVVWPYLLAALWLNRGRPTGIRPWLLTLVGLCVLLLALGWGYHILLGGTEMWVDILLYFLVMVLGFWLPSRASGPFDGPLWQLPLVLTLVLVALILRFTWWTPTGLLFADLSDREAAAYSLLVRA
jgi:hypothetical protein